MKALPPLLGNPIVWRPTADIIEKTHLTQFMRLHQIQSFDDLILRSSEDIRWFTEAILDYLNIRFRKPYSNIVDLKDGIAWAKWCIDGRLNIVESCLEQYLDTPIASQSALLWEGEDREIKAFTYQELSQDVNRTANALRQLGLGKGDPIGLYMPMIPEVVIALLAIAKIGAVILPLFSGYGAGAVAQRLADAEAKALFTADGFHRRGKAIALKKVADQAILSVPTIKVVIVTRNIGDEIPMMRNRDYWWHDLIPSQPSAAPYEDTDAEDLLMIIYTSGTSGEPKGAVHPLWVPYQVCSGYGLWDG